MKLRLLIRPDCDRACPGCCNKQWDLRALPVCTDYTPYSKIMLTGGEPMLDWPEVAARIFEIRSQTEAPIFMYTARTHPPHQLGIVLTHLSGVTITLHEQKDVEPFLRFAAYVDRWKLWKGRTLRVNVFKPIELPNDPLLARWIIKRDVEWIIDCPLPDDEVFMRVKFDTMPETMAPGTNWTGKR